MRRKILSSTNMKLLVACVDVLIYILSFVAAFLLRFGLHPIPYNVNPMLHMLPFFVAGFIILSLIYRLYSEYVGKSEIIVSLGCIVVLSLVLDLGLTFLLRQFGVPRTIFAIASLIQFVFLSLWRYVVWQKHLLLLQPRKAVLFINQNQAEMVQKALLNHMGRVICLESVFTYSDSEEAKEVWENFVRADIPVELVLFSGSLGETLILDLLDYCIVKRVKVMLLPGMYEVLLQNARLISAGDVPIFQLQGIFEKNWLVDAGKRLLDVCVSWLGLICLLPFFVFIAIAIKLDSRGPVFYSQTRVGRHHTTFKVYKFRTMQPDAEDESGPVLCSDDDPRITRVGRFLRKTRLDEIPQLWNVLLGNMSLVGPRPERPYFVDAIKQDIPMFEHRHQIPGGITGLAQIEGRYSTLPENKLTYDFIYAQNNSPVRDLIIILRTLGVLFDKKKAS